MGIGLYVLQLGGRINETLKAIIETTSSRLARKWRNQSRDDIRQNLYLWCTEKGIDGDEIFETDDSEEVYKVINALKSKLWWTGEKYCQREYRQQKALREGYSPEDEYFYSLRQLEHLLENYFVTGLEGSAPRTSESPSKGTGDPAEGGNYLACLIDLQRGLQGLIDVYAARLRYRYGLFAGMSDGEVASQYPTDLLGSTEGSVRHRSRTALKALQKNLGGPNPWTKDVA